MKVSAVRIRASAFRIGRDFRHLLNCVDAIVGSAGCGRTAVSVDERTRDPHVALSIEGTEIQPPGLKQYLVVHGRARVVEGGAPELLQRLAHVYLGPDVTFPPMADPPAGHVMRITVERIGGVGPWSALAHEEPIP